MNLKTKVLFLLTFSIFFTFGQDINKQKKEFFKLFEKQDTNFVVIGENLIRYYQYYKPDSALYFIDLMQNFENLSKISLANLLFSKARIYYYLGDKNLSIINFSKALILYQQLNKKYQIASTLTRMAKLLSDKDTNGPAFQFAYSALKISKESTFLDIEAKSYITLAYLFTNSGYFFNAQKYLDTAYHLASNLKNLGLLSEYYWYLAYFNKLKGNFKSAEAYFIKSYSLTQDPFYYINSNIDLSELYYENGLYHLALNTLNKIEKLSELYKNSIFITKVYFLKSKIYFETGKFNLALEYAHKTINKASSFNNLNLVKDAYLLILDIYLKTKDFEMAKIYFNLYTQTAQQIMNETSIQNRYIITQNYKILQRLNEQENLNLQRELQILKNKEQKKAITYLFVIVLLLIMIIAILFYLYIYKIKNERYLKQLTEATLEGIYIHDGQKIIECNNRILEMTGYTKNELIGQPINILFPEESMILVRQKSNMYKTVFYRFKMKKKDGTTFDVDLLSKPFVYKGIKAKVISVRDISDYKKIQKQLDESKQIFATLTETSPDGIVLVNKEGNIIYYSESFINIFGIKEKDSFLNVNISLLLSPDSFESFNKSLQKLANGQKIDYSEAKAIKISDYTNFYIEYTGNCLKNEKNEIIAIFLIIRDITERKKSQIELQKSIALFRSLFINANEAIIIFNKKNFTITSANPIAHTILGEQILENKNILNYFVDKNEFENKIKNYKSFEITAISSHLGNFDVLASVSDIDENSSMIIIRNISDIKENQKKLEGTLIKLQNIINTRDKLFSIISHDLRGPIGSINEMLKFLYENFDTLDKSELNKILGFLADSARNTFELTDNLLEWAKTQLNKIVCNKKIFEINTLIYEVINKVKSIADNKLITIKFYTSENYHVIADPEMIRVVVRNLVMNAIKFSKLNSSIEINIKEYDEYIKVSVKDYGIGMSQEEIEKIFVYNQQYTKIGTQKEKGSGLGLQICNEYIKMNDGEIFVESIVNQGTTISFTLKKA